MPEQKNLNVAPYFDDFDEEDNFVRTLFRPGFAIQARELTQLQSALQNQIERHGNHIFKEGAMVIPGQISLLTDYYSLKLASTFGFWRKKSLYPINTLHFNPKYFAAIENILPL